MRFSGQSEDGARIVGEYDPAQPDETFITVTDKDGVTLYTSDGADPASPEFETTQDGFNASAAFTTQGDDTVDGSVSGAC